MRFSSIFIDRPVLGIVLNLLIVLLGLTAVGGLGVRDYPAVDPPVVSVSTHYAGASADVIESKITEPLEGSINGISGVRTLTSSSSNGGSNITVEFNLGVDLEDAANDVRDRVSRAMRSLPADVDNPIVTKADANTSPILFVTLRSDRRTPLEITDLANNLVKERLQTIPDVSEVRIFGEKRFSIRLWMDPALMTAHGITGRDIHDALSRENIELPAGSVEGNSTELSVRNQSGLSTLEDFNNLVIREDRGRLIRFRDVGRAEEGAENERAILKRDGVPMVGVALLPQAGANHIAIADEFYRRLERLKRDLPPDARIEIGYDTTRSIRRSVTEVAETILLAFLLVVLVIFVFLRDWRATLLPVLAMPISLIGSFFLLSVFDFSINVLTLLGLVLATGLVVDDAIVVLENIYRKIEEGMDPREAGHKGASEIFFAILSTTMALVAVLLPVIFMQGLTGRLFREFGTVVAGSVLLSAFVSLSITPMLCTRLLRRGADRQGSFHARTEPFFQSIIAGYRRSLTGFMRRRTAALGVFLLSAFLIVFFFQRLPRELAPVEDRGRLLVAATGPEGASFEYMAAFQERLTALVDRTVPEQDAQIATVPGFGSGGVNSASLRLMLTDPAERSRTQQEIARQITRDASRLSEARVVVTQEPTIGDRRGGLPVQFVILAPDLERLRTALPAFLQEAAHDPAFLVTDVNLKFNKPEITVTVDRDQANAAGIAAADVGQALQLSLSGSRWGYFIREGRQYPIIGQFHRTDRDQPGDLYSIYVRGKDGRSMALANLLSFQETSNPPQRYHFNRYASATVSAALAEGVTLGQGLSAMERIADTTLDESFSTALSGQSRDFAESTSSLLYTFLFALALIYLVLAAQFESFRHPLTVMLTVPMALAGALLSLWYFNQSLNIFSQIGIIMLVGLVTKNGILIVEFANQRRRTGLDPTAAVIDAAASRFRPIVMTTLTVILGALPIALALGGGAESRMSMGIAVIGGLLFSLALSLFVIPVMYVLLAPRASD